MVRPPTRDSTVFLSGLLPPPHPSCFFVRFHLSSAVVAFLPFPPPLCFFPFLLSPFSCAPLARAAPVHPRLDRVPCLCRLPERMQDDSINYNAHWFRADKAGDLLEDMPRFNPARIARCPSLPTTQQSTKGTSISMVSQVLAVRGCTPRRRRAGLADVSAGPLEGPAQHLGR